MDPKSGSGRRRLKEQILSNVTGADPSPGALPDLVVAWTDADGVEHERTVPGEAKNYPFARYVESYGRMTDEDATPLDVLSAMVGVERSIAQFIPDDVATKILGPYLDAWGDGARMFKEGIRFDGDIPADILGDLPVVQPDEDFASKVTFGQMEDVRAEGRLNEDNAFRAMWHGLAILVQPNYSGDEAVFRKYVDAIGGLSLSRALDLNAFFLFRLPQWWKLCVAPFGRQMESFARLQSAPGKPTS